MAAPYKEINMVKFSAKLADGKTLVGLGIVRANVERLMKGMPMSILFGHVIDQDSELKAKDVQLIIFYGETEEAIAKDVEKFISEQTRVEDHRKPGP